MDGHFAASAAVTHRAAPSTRRPALAVAAAVVVAVVGVVTLILSDTTARTDVGELREVTLADGSRVVLDTATRLETAYGNTERHLNLPSGRARFDVSHGDPRPFIVDAGGLEVHATGTRFDVRRSGPSRGRASRRPGRTADRRDASPASARSGGRGGARRAGSAPG